MTLAKEWGVRPAEILNWSEIEVSLALSYLVQMAEANKPPES